MSIYTQKTSKGQLMSASVVRLASGRYKVEVRGIEPFYEADNTFETDAAATKHAQAMLDEFGWRLEEMYERDATAEVTPPPAPFVMKSNEPNVWYIEPVTSADGDKIEGRITQNERGYVVHAVSKLASGLTTVSNGVQFDSFRGALEDAGTLVEIELNRLNQQRAIEMGDEIETIYPPLMGKHDRIAQLRREIEQNEQAIIAKRREIEDLLGE